MPTKRATKSRRTPAEIAADTRRTGRPPRPGKLRSVAILVRATPDERRRLDADARAAGLSVPNLLMRPWRHVKPKRRATR
jgi:hypothetical protein